MSQTEPPALVEHFFRHEYGRSVGALVRRFGASHLALIEECVQSAMLIALESWGRQNIPENPGAWIQLTAKRKAIDVLRRKPTGALLSESELSDSTYEATEPRFSGELEDDTLRMLVVCCDPELSRRTQLALSLKILCGFGSKEIANALMQKEEAIRKRIARGRDKLRSLAQFDRPSSAESISAIHQVLYLLFNKGYQSSSDERPVQNELCREAIRLTSCLTQHPVGDTPTSWALLALMHLHHARRDARLDSRGALLLLDEQDRSRWDPAEIQQGLYCLSKSADGEVFSRFHAEAGVLAQHCVAPSFEETNWQEIVSLYEIHEALCDSPIHTLNRAIAVAEWKGPAAGLQLLEAMSPPTWLSRWYLWDATLGELYRRSGNLPRARAHLEQASARAPSESERARIARRLRRLSE